MSTVEVQNPYSSSAVSPFKKDMRFVFYTSHEDWSISYMDNCYHLGVSLAHEDIKYVKDKGVQSVLTLFENIEAALTEQLHQSFGQILVLPTKGKSRMEKVSSLTLYWIPVEDSFFSRKFTDKKDLLLATLQTRVLRAPCPSS